MTTMVSFRNLGRGASAVVIMALALCLLAGTALAYWTSIGSGFGQASVGSLGQPTITSVTAPAGSSNSLAINWTGPTAAPEPTSYRIDVAGTGGQSANSGCSTTTCAATVTGLAPDTAYTVTVTSLLHNSWTAASEPYAGRTNIPSPSSFAFTTPIDGEDEASATTVFAGTTSDTNTVTIQVHSGSDTSTAVIRTLAAPADGVTWTSSAVDPALPTGATYTAVATQTNAGGTATAESTFRVPTPAPMDGTAPTQQITVPSADAVVTPGLAISVTGTASDPSGVTSLRLQRSIDGGTLWVNFGTATSAAANATATRQVSDNAAPTTGTVKYRTLATDGAGNTASSDVRTMTIAVANIDVVEGDDFTNDTTPPVSGRATAAGAVLVRVCNEDVSITDCDEDDEDRGKFTVTAGGAPFSWSTPGLPVAVALSNSSPRPYTLVATDSRGVITRRVIYWENTAPNVTVNSTTPASGSNTQPTFTGNRGTLTKLTPTSGTPRSADLQPPTVVITDAGGATVSTGDATTAAGSTWTYQPATPLAAPGNYTVAVSQSDGAGNERTVTRTYSILGQPTLSVTGPGRSPTASGSCYGTGAVTFTYTPVAGSGTGDTPPTRTGESTNCSGGTYSDQVGTSSGTRLTADWDYTVVARHNGFDSDPFTYLDA